MLTEKLTIEQQQELLSTLFGFNFEDVGEGHTVLYDEEGYEFYGCNEHCQFDFSTLAGIFSYTAYRAKNRGYSDAQFNMRKALGLT
jgi:hypothetical protein